MEIKNKYKMMKNNSSLFIALKNKNRINNKILNMILKKNKRKNKRIIMGIRLMKKYISINKQLSKLKMNQKKLRHYHKKMLGNR